MDQSDTLRLYLASFQDSRLNHFICNVKSYKKSSIFSHQSWVKSNGCICSNPHSASHPCLLNSLMRFRCPLIGIIVKVYLENNRQDLCFHQPIIQVINLDSVQPWQAISNYRFGTLICSKYYINRQININMGICMCMYI